MGGAAAETSKNQQLKRLIVEHSLKTNDPIEVLATAVLPRVCATRGSATSVWSKASTARREGREQLQKNISVVRSHTNVIGQDARDGFIRQRIQSRKGLKMHATKKDFFGQLETSPN